MGIVNAVPDNSQAAPSKIARVGDISNCTWEAPPLFCTYIFNSLEAPPPDEKLIPPPLEKPIVFVLPPDVPVIDTALPTMSIVISPAAVPPKLTALPLAVVPLPLDKEKDEPGK